MIIQAALPDRGLLSQTGSDKASETSKETTPGDDQGVRWGVVAVAGGLAEAAIIRGRLESEGIPAQVQQEPAGVVYGLTVGRLGQARVLVPEPLVEQATEILSQQQDVANDEDD